MIKPKQISVWECQCDTCTYEWTTRSSKIPKVCSNCKSKNWNKTNKISRAVLDVAESIINNPQQLNNAGGAIAGALSPDIVRIPSKVKEGKPQDYCRKCGKHYSDGCGCEIDDIIPIEEAEGVQG